MELKPNWFQCGYWGTKENNPFFAMRILLLLTAFLRLSAHAQPGAEKISLHYEQASLETVIKAIQKQSDFSFVYTREQLQRAAPVTVQLHAVSLSEALRACFSGQPFTYSIEGKHIALREKTTLLPAATKEVPVSGTVRDEGGKPIAAITVAVKDGGPVTATNDQGYFTLKGVAAQAVIRFSGIGFRTQEVALNGQRSLAIQLKTAVSVLDDTVVIAYGTTTRRLNTGSVGKVGAADISKQPVTNPLATLQGRIAGLYIAQSTGLPGSNFSVQIRGQHSLKQGNQPLYIVDGVTFMLNSGTLSQISLFDINHPLNTINPLDIESIEVLKDADATAIYGSQGANGVILITTKKGKVGKTSIDIHAWTGISQVTRTLPLLRTPDYLAMRKEAFLNDGTVPNTASAPDLVLWDSTRYTDWKEALIGGQAFASNAQVSFSGGTSATRFLATGGYHRESTVFPFDPPSERGTGRLQVNHSSQNKKFSASFSSAFSTDVRRLPYTDLTSAIFLPPNTPAAFTGSGEISWADWVEGVDNPFATQYTQYRSQMDNLVGNAVLNYVFLPGLSLKLNAGYNLLTLQEETKIPIVAQRPSAATTGVYKTAGNRLHGYLLEPQASYSKRFLKADVNVLAGLSFQDRKQRGHLTEATGYTNDDLLGSLSAAGLVTGNNSFTAYRYMAGFGRVRATWDKKYTLNLNARRDGSSRFGPANRFSNFGSVGAAWLFSEELFFRKLAPLLSFGKLRGSYGVTGNDQIGDYQYLDGWRSAATYTYQQNPGLLPVRLFNPYFGWERNKKLEIAMELGFFANRLLLTTAYYRNRSDNQLVNYKLPYATGFTTILKNLDALVQNSGLEIEVTANLLTTAKASWTISGNLTIPDNKLLRYPGLELSTDRNNYEIGEPLTIVKQYHYTGINKQTGVYQFADQNGDGILTPSDLTVLSFTGQQYYGGLSSEARFGGLAFSFLFQFVKQQGRSYTGSLMTLPGTLGNQPAYVSDRWTVAFPEAAIQRYSAGASAAAAAYTLFQQSNGSISDASFVRLKNLSLSYSLPDHLLTRLRFTTIRIYLQGQNQLTFTRYPGADPENQSISSLPLLKTYSAGIQLSF